MDDVRRKGYRTRPRRGYAYKTHLKRDDSAKAHIDRRHRKDDEPVDGGDGVIEGGRWTLDVCGDVQSLELATTARERLRGMLFRDPDDVTRLLVPCHDVHTFGLRHPLDIAFISRDGIVLDVHRNVATMRRLRDKRASLVAERFSKDDEWLKKGDVIRIGSE